MRILSISMAAVMLTTAALASCTPEDTTIQAKLKQTCPLLTDADAAFIAVTIVTKVPQKTIDAEHAAYAGVKTFCDDPASVTVGNAPLLVLDALLAVTKALADANAG
jgi:hypothetical protein